MSVINVNDNAQNNVLKQNDMEIYNAIQCLPEESFNAKSYSTKEATIASTKIDIRSTINENPNNPANMLPYSVCETRFMAGHKSTTNLPFTIKS